MLNHKILKFKFNRPLWLARFLSLLLNGWLGFLHYQDDMVTKFSDCPSASRLLTNKVGDGPYIMMGISWGTPYTSQFDAIHVWKVIS